MRKIIILTAILILSIAFVSAEYQKTTERFTLEEGQSIEFNGKKLTLLNLDFENEKVIVCVNGERTILSKRKTKTVNDAILDLREVTMNKAEIRMWVNCPKCECDESCDNSICFDECYEDKDCDDGNDLTEDKCYGTPKKCYNKIIEGGELEIGDTEPQGNTEGITSKTTYEIPKQINVSGPKLTNMFLLSIIFILAVALVYKKFLLPKY